MVPLMKRRMLRTDRLIVALGVVVLVLGGIVLAAATHGRGFSPAQETPAERAEAQLREFAPGLEVRYVQDSQSPNVLCGYAGRVGGPKGGDIIFISRPTRLLLQTDPLPDEFDRTLKQFCPGFLRDPRKPAP